MVNEREHMGAVIKNLTPLHDLEYKVVFNLHENTFFQKLISKEVLERVRVRPIDYLKALMFLDYSSRIIQSDFSVCDNLENLSKAIRDKERKEEEEKGLPNKDDQGASYFNLETVVLETGLWAKEKRLNAKNKGLTKAEIKQIKKRYDNEQKVDLSSANARKLEPFYEGIGEMVCCQVSDNMKPYLFGVSSRADLGALIFSDYVLKFLNNKKAESEIYSKLKSKDYLSASIVAYNHLTKDATIDKLRLALEQTSK